MENGSAPRIKAKLKKHIELVDIVNEYLQSKLSKVRKDRRSMVTYDKANWPYRMSHLNAKEEVYEDLIDLFTLKETKTS